MRDLIQRIRKVERLTSDQGELVRQEAETKQKVIDKQAEIEREVQALKQSRLYREAVARQRGSR